MLYSGETRAGLARFCSVASLGGIVKTAQELAMARLIVSRIAVITALAAAIGASAANAQSSTGQITVLYDAFGKTSSMTKDWGFAALVEYGGKRILFDTGKNAGVFAPNSETNGT